MPSVKSDNNDDSYIKCLFCNNRDKYRIDPHTIKANDQSLSNLKIFFKHSNIEVIYAEFNRIRFLDICNNFKSVKELYLRGNFISSLPSECEMLINLKKMDLSDNVISNYYDIYPLKKCNNLTTLNLLHNPICSKPYYPDKITKHLIQLKFLDESPTTTPPLYCMSSIRRPHPKSRTVVVSDLSNIPTTNSGNNSRRNSNTHFTSIIPVSNQTRNRISLVDNSIRMNNIQNQSQSLPSQSQSQQSQSIVPLSSNPELTARFDTFHMMFNDDSIPITNISIISTVRLPDRIANISIDEAKYELNMLDQVEKLVTPFTDNYYKVIHERCLRYQKLCLKDKDYIKPCCTYNVVSYGFGKKEDLFITAILNEYPHLQYNKDRIKILYLLLDEIDKWRDIVRREEESNLLNS